MKNAGIIIAVILVLAGGFFLYKSQKTATSPQTSTTQSNDKMMKAAPTEVMAPTSGAMKEAAGAVKEFTVTGKKFSFTPATLTVNKGDKVKITFKNAEGMHNFMLDEFNAKTKTIQSGAEDTVEFTADKTGSFEYYCGVGNHRAMGMKGTLTVK
jgi:cytochrome c oxidase subunit 2